MRADLLYAQAAIDWAVSNFPSLEERTNSWVNRNLYVTLKDAGPNSPNNVLVILEREPLPISTQVEVGAYLNAIRSGLDILATTLAHRHSVPNPDNAYFPVASGIDAFRRGDYKGNKFVKALPAAEQAIIESLQPYKGGNDTLWVLHHLDIVRKHRRLLTVEARLGSATIVNWGPSTDFIPLPGPLGSFRVNDETVLGLLPKGTPQPNVNFTAFVTIDEPDTGFLKPLMPALSDFSSTAEATIKLFDY
jgi:hypothetical protein